MNHETIVVVFAFNRPEHLAKTLSALAKNLGAESSKIIIYCDGPRCETDVSAIRETQAIAKHCMGFDQVEVIFRQKNLGLSKSIINGVTEQLEKHEKIIVLEDDMVTSPYFLQYMNDALDFYRDDERVISIHGYVYPVKDSLPETFFLRGADCWGWATWRRGWKHFNPDGRYLLKELKRQNLLSQFNMGGAFEYSRMLQDQIQGKNDSWAIRWHASAFLENRLTLYPGISLVHNIGNDGTGTHCKITDHHNVLLSTRPIQVQEIPVEPSELALNAFQEYLRQIQNRPISKLGKIKRMLTFYNP